MSQNQISKHEAEIEKEKGNKLFKIGKFDDAIQCYTKAISIDPTNAILYGNRAMAYHKKGSVFEALADCDSALSIDNSYVKAYYRRGVLRKQLHRYNLAVEDFNKVIELDANNKEAHNEIKFINELINKNKKIKIEPIEKPKEFQSNKPLVNVPIKQFESQLKITDIKVPSKVPQTYYQFECDWRELVGPNKFQLRLEYLQMIDTDENKLSEIFLLGIEPQILFDIIEVLEHCKDAYFVFRILNLLTEVPRFDTYMLFQTDTERQTLENIFVKLKNTLPLPRDSLLMLATKWLVRSTLDFKNNLLL